MKITVYTTTDCQFSKAEKEYLTSHSLPFEEKNLETNKEFLTEMLAVSNNFAGTPVTRVEKDDGTIAVLKGFTKEEFNTTFGFNIAPPVASEPPKVEEPKPPEAQTPVPEAMPQTTIPSPATVPPSTPPVADEKLGSVLDKLEEKTEAPQTPTETSTAPTTPPAADTPAIPDFSADSAPQPIK